MSSLYAPSIEKLNNPSRIKIFTLIKLSCLHFGQYRGKFFISVSSLIFMRVLLSHIGQNIQ